MTDIAQLGLAIDSSQANAATVALGNLQKAATPAAQAMADLQSASAPAAQALNQINTASGNAATGSDAASESLRGQRNVIRAISTDLAIFGTGIAQTAGLMGTLYIENAHLIEGFGGFTAALKEIATPTNLLIGGIVGMGAAVIATASSIAASETQFANLASMSNTTLSSLHGLESAASFKGIDTSDFLKAMTDVETLTAEASHNTGSLADLFQVNNVQAGTLQQNIASIANLMANVTNEADKYRLLTSLGLPATYQWVQFLSQGAAGIKQATDEASKFGDAADLAFVAKAREFDEAWATGWKNFTTGAKAAFVDVTGLFDTLKMAIASGMMALGDSGLPTRTLQAQLEKQGGKVQSMSQSQANSFYDAFGKNTFTNPGPTTATALPVDQKTDLNLQNQQIAALGSLASVTQTVTQKQNELTLARMTPGSMITDQDVSRITAYTQAMALGTYQITTQTDAQKIAAAEVGMGVGATAAYTAEQTKLADFAQRGITLTDAQSASLHKVAQAYGEASAAASLLKLQSDTSFATSQLGRSDYDQQAATAMRAQYGDNYTSQMNSAVASQIKMNAALTDVKSTASSALSGFLQDLNSGKSASEALTNALTKVENKIFDIASNQIVSSLMSGSTGGLSAITGLFGVHHTGYGPGDAYPTRAVEVSAFANAPRFHSGVGPGERAAVIRDDESVLTPGQMKALGAMISTSNSSPAPAAATPPQVNIGIQNYSGQPASVQQSSSSGGGQNLTVIVGQIKASIANDIARGGTSINTALERRYAVNPAIGNVR